MSSPAAAGRHLQMFLLSPFVSTENNKRFLDSARNDKKAQVKLCLNAVVFEVALAFERFGVLVFA